MAIMLGKPPVDGLSDVVDMLREWSYDEAPMQLHPGDLGWHWSAGAEATASAVRTWIRNGQILAVGLLDGPELLRLAIAPDAQHDEELGRQMLADVTQPPCGVLPQGRVSIEARGGPLLQALLIDDGWVTDEPWTPLQRDLAAPVGDPGVRVELVGWQQGAAYTAVHRSSFGSPTFTDERWRPGCRMPTPGHWSPTSTGTRWRR